MKTKKAHLGKMEARLKRCGAKLDALKAAGSEDWETIRAGVESACSELEGAFKELTR